jgi:hypothetical protein
MRPSYEEADNDDSDEENRDNSVKYAKDNSAHDLMKRLYHIFFWKRNEWVPAQ